MRALLETFTYPETAWTQCSADTVFSPVTETTDIQDLTLKYWPSSKAKYLPPFFPHWGVFRLHWSTVTLRPEDHTATSSPVTEDWKTAVCCLLVTGKRYGAISQTISEDASNDPIFQKITMQSSNLLGDQASFRRVKIVSWYNGEQQLLLEKKAADHTWSFNF